MDNSISIKTPAKTIATNQFKNFLLMKKNFIRNTPFNLSNIIYLKYINIEQDKLQVGKYLKGLKERLKD